MAGWIPPGRAGDPLKWQLDLQKGWLPPGTVGDPSGVQYEMGHDFDPADRDVGYQFLHSPPGVQAPADSINWTPGRGGKGEIHGPGVQAPIDQPNISVLPVGAARTSWRDQLFPQGGVGSGQAGGSIDPNEDWRKASILQDNGGLYVGAGQGVDAPETEGLPQVGSATSAHYKEWPDLRPGWEGVVWRQRVDANDKPLGDAYQFKPRTDEEIIDRNEKEANAQVPGGRWENNKDRDARLRLQEADDRAKAADARAEEANTRAQAAADRQAAEDARKAAAVQPNGTIVNDPRTGKPTAIWSGDHLVQLPREGAPDGPVPDPVTGAIIGQVLNGQFIPSPAARAKPAVTTTDPATGETIYYDPNTGKATPITSKAPPKDIQVSPGVRIVQPNPETGAIEEKYKAPPNWQIAQVGNKLVAFNPDVKPGEKPESQIIAEAPEQIRQMGNGIFFVPAGQTLKITGGKGGDRMVSGGPKEGWASQDPTKTGTPGQSLFGTEDASAQGAFLEKAGGDRARAQDLWSQQHKDELNEITQAGRDPSTTRSVWEVRSPAAGGPAAAAEAPPPVPSIHPSARWDQEPSSSTPPPPQEGWVPPPGWTPPLVQPGVEEYPQASMWPGVGQGQAAPPMPGMPPAGPPQGSVGPESGWQPPLDPSQVVGGGNKFGDQVSMEGTHMGTDLQAYKGTPAMSPVDGQVVAVKDEPSGLGLQVSIRDAQGQIHTLAHLDHAGVQPGEQVRMGQNVAAVGESGAGATGPHLDYRIAGPDGTPVNPEPRMGGLAQLPPHPNTVGEGQATKGWKPKVSLDASQSKDGTWRVGGGQDQPAPVPSIHSGFDTPVPSPAGASTGGGTVDVTLYQQQMDQQADQFKKSLAAQKQQTSNQMTIAKMQHEVNLKNARTLAERQNEEERYNYVNQQLQEQAKFIDAQISYTQMATTKDIAILQVAGQLTATGMNNETALRQAQLQTTAQLAGKQMEMQTQLQTQGTFGQRTTADLLKTSLTNPWLQQLSGMAPGYGAPGGPGASGGGGTGGILQPLLQGWNAEVPSGAVSPFGNTEQTPDYGSMFGEQLNRGTSPNTYTDWLDPSRLDPVGSQSLYPSGLTQSFPKITSKGLQEPASFGSGQSVGDQLAGGGGQPASWGPYAANAQSTAGWGGYAPLATPPPEPTWQQWQAMTPFERASYRTLVQAAEPWALGVQNLRIKWGQEGGPTSAPGTSQLGAMTRDPMGRMGVSQTAEVFGEDPGMYWQSQQKDWSKAQQPAVTQIT